MITNDVLLTVSGTIDPDLRRAIADGRRPRADFLEMADAFGADLLDHREALATSGRLGRAVRRLLGDDVLLALACFQRRKRYRIVFTDGEQVGIPYAVMTWLARRRPRHVMIGHILSPRKKALLHRVARLERRVDVLVVYASAQRTLAIERLRYAPERVMLTSFMVDTRFWRADAVDSAPRDRPMICAVGLERRDYPTLIRAVTGLDVDVVVAAASPWSKQESTARGVELPPNVIVEPFDQYGLRDLYGAAAFVVVPLQETDFQAGITTILEGMSMTRAVVCTRTEGQTDAVQDGVNGIYVPPGDAAELRATIAALLADPARAEALGAEGRRWACRHADIGVYATRLADAIS